MVLDGIFHPDFIYVDDDQVYITEGVTISIFSLKDHTLTVRFGKPGEGPEEFKTHRHNSTPLFLDVQTDQLLISSQGKISWFSKAGTFIKERKLMNGRSVANYQPVGNNYIAYRNLSETTAHYNLLILTDNVFNDLKQLAKQKNPFQFKQKMDPIARELKFLSDITCNHIVADVSNNSLVIFDAQGKKRFTVEPNVPKIKLASNHKEKVLDYYRTDPQRKQYLDYMKRHIHYPFDHLPLIRTWAVADGKIYVMTYDQKKDESKTLCLVYDKTGKQVARNFIPLRFESFLEAYPYTIKNNTLYQVIENDDEEWELHSTPID